MKKYKKDSKTKTLNFTKYQVIILVLESITAIFNFLPVLPAIIIIIIK